MGLQQNVADMMCALKKNSGKSMVAFSEELGISSSTLQDYLKANGNPTIKMIEHLARKMDIDPIALVMGRMDPEQDYITLLLLDTIQAIADLPQPKRIKFAELFLELVQLWEGDD